ncbi:MAG: hypothetical protein KC656_11160, partial [Myxococcales bacterium]|nr:hypothetical protein [Myxococcales bacterium]
MEQPGTRLRVAMDAAARRQRDLALVPILGMVGCTSIGAPAIVVLRSLGVTEVAPAIAGTLAVECAVFVVCAWWVRRSPGVAGQIAALVEIAFAAVQMQMSPEIGVPVCSLAIGLGAVVGTLTGPPGALRWGPIASIAWMVGLGLSGVVTQDFVALLVFPPLLLFAVTALVGRVTLSMDRDQRTALATLAELESANVRLEEQTARAEEASRTKSGFLASMSHEL